MTLITMVLLIHDRCPSDLAAKRALNKKLIVKVPRATTCDWMITANQFWHMCTGSSINGFSNVNRLREIGFELLVLEGVHNMEPEALNLLKQDGDGTSAVPIGPGTRSVASTNDMPRMDAASGSNE